ncbi:MAG: hypothetical protein ILP12_02830 [Lachnospiraceae bacterium]|nr:hypothetical protein [Lachnospiraceae bacterium]
MKKSLYFIISLAAAVLALAGLVLFLITNGTAGYGIPGSGLGILCGIVAIAAICGAAYLSQKSGSQSILTGVVKIVAIVALMAELGILLADRVGLAANIFTWDSGNQLGWSVFGVSVAAAVCILLSAIALIVNAFIVEEPQA